MNWISWVAMVFCGVIALTQFVLYIGATLQRQPAGMFLVGGLVCSVMAAINVPIALGVWS